MPFLPFLPSTRRLCGPRLLRAAAWLCQGARGNCDMLTVHTLTSLGLLTSLVPFSRRKGVE